MVSPLTSPATVRDRCPIPSGLSMQLATTRLAFAHARVWGRASLIARRGRRQICIDRVWQQNRDPLEQCQRHLGTCEWHSLHRAAVANRQTLCLVASALPHIHVHMGQQFPHQPYFAQRFASDGYVAGFVHVCWVTHTCTHSSTPATTSLTRYIGMYVHG